MSTKIKYNTGRGTILDELDIVKQRLQNEIEYTSDHTTKATLESISEDVEYIIDRTNKLLDAFLDAMERK